jgi:hypothetical protein
MVDYNGLKVKIRAFSGVHPGIGWARFVETVGKFNGGVYEGYGC